MHQHGRLLEALKNVEARIADTQATARGNEQGGAAVLAQWREASKRRNEEVRPPARPRAACCSGAARLFCTIRSPRH
eukprot:5017499-Prymnesium_polylepis.1